MQNQRAGTQRSHQRNAPDFLIVQIGTAVNSKTVTNCTHMVPSQDN